MATPGSGTIAVLAEKPSVARDIARVLGATSRGDRYPRYLTAKLGVESRNCTNIAGSFGFTASLEGARIERAPPGIDRQRLSRQGVSNPAVSLPVI